MILFSSLTEIQQKIKNALILSCNTGVADTKKHVDPNIRNNFIGSIADSMSAGFDENNDKIKEVLNQLFPQTATDEYLDLWCGFFGITRKPAVKSEGYIVFTGVAGTIIPAGTLIKKSDDTQYTLQTASTISSNSINCTITRVGTIATATTSSNHNLSTGLSVVIAGAGQSEYNITSTITVISETQFTYEVSGSPLTPATGTITATATFGNGFVYADVAGVSGNSIGGSQLSLVSPIIDVDDICYLPYNGLYYGQDAEDDEDLRVRLLQRTSSFVAPFTEVGIPVFLREKVSGITRVWVQSATPSAGYVSIYFTRDNDANIIPNSTQVLQAKNAIIDFDNGIKPANMSDTYVVVSAPTAVPIAITFSSLSPNTTIMKNAIQTTLTDYFKSDAVAVDKDITVDEIKSVIFNVVDEEGNSPTFTLSLPSSTTSISSSQLATLGVISYA
jgi:uncharacterized phage protein gp47/JayE